MPEERKSKSKSRSKRRKKERRERDSYYDDYDDPWRQTRRGMDNVIGTVVPAYVGILGLGLLGGALNDYHNRSSGGGGSNGSSAGGGDVGGSPDIEPNTQYGDGDYSIEPRYGMEDMSGAGMNDMHSMGMDGMSGMGDMSTGRMVGGNRRHRATPAATPGKVNVRFN